MPVDTHRSYIHPVSVYARSKAACRRQEKRGQKLYRASSSLLVGRTHKGKQSEQRLRLFVSVPVPFVTSCNVLQDSTALSVCHVARARQHRTFLEWARKSKNGMGWW